jgi:ketosteroid isomerase-like protein
MAEHPNVTLTRRGYQAFAEQDVATLTELIADDTVWHLAGRSPISGTYKGRDEVFGFFMKLAEVTGGSLKQDIHAILADDEHAVVILSASVTVNGKSMTGNQVHISHMRNGQIVEFWDASPDMYEFDELFN